MDLLTHRAIVERAATQLDHITRPQMHEMGIPDHAIRRASRAEVLHVAGRRTFRLGGGPPTFEQRAMAACLDTGGVASHRTAAALHPLQGFEPPEVIDVIIVHGRRHSGSPIAQVHATTNLPPDDLVHIGPIPCTGVARTFLGLAALVPEVAGADLRDAFDVAARDGLVSEAWMWWRLEELRCRGRNGVSAMEELLRRRQQLGPTESWLERTFMELLEQHGIRLPTVQRRIRNRSGRVVRVDTIYDDRSLVIELDGYGGHSTRAQKNRDEARRTRLVADKHKLMVFTYDQVVCEPDEVVALVKTTLEWTGP